MSDEYERYHATYIRQQGADIRAKFLGEEIATFEGITWSITREKAPIYTMGSNKPRSFHGKRGIAGSFIPDVTIQAEDLVALLPENNPDKYTTWTCGPGARDLSDKDRALRYADQMPPFDVEIFFDNEDGARQSLWVYGLEVILEGSGASEFKAEETNIFVARDVGPVTRVEG